MAFDFVLVADTARCVEICTEASAIENQAMELDREGRADRAAEAYRRAAAQLLEAVEVCPEEHPDRQIIEQHAEEVLMRAVYLENLQGEDAEIALEDHINGVQLTMEGGLWSPPVTPTTARAPGRRLSNGEGGLLATGKSPKKVMGAAAAIGASTGLLLMGPVSAAALGAAAAYATTREDKAGSAVRQVGIAGIQVVHRARTIDEQYRISTRATAAGQSAIDQALALGSKYTPQALSEINQRHKVTDKIGWGLHSASSALSSLVSKATR